MTIQSASGVSGKSYGFENLARFGPQASSRHGREGASDASVTVELTPEQQRAVDRLRQIDRQVRAHEQAHLSVGRELVRGGASFAYEVGPDKKRYAVAGEVSIDVSPGRTPEETIPKAQHIRATALAPADPSPQDYRVAGSAGQMESDARAELAVQRREEESGAISDGLRQTAFYRRVEFNSGAGQDSGVDLYA